jgi:hypothetical protein
MNAKSGRWVIAHCIDATPPVEDDDEDENEKLPRAF